MAQTWVRNRSRRCDAAFPLIVSTLLLIATPRAFAGSATLTWDPVNDTSVAGYMLYYGPTAGAYTSKMDVGNATSRALPNLTDGGTYHFAVTAYDASHTESAFSNDASTTIPYSSPAANFTSSIATGVAPLAINFTSTSTGSVSAYAWSFGDGTASSSASPSHVYSVAGIYSVSLTVSGPGGSNTKTLPNAVTVTAARIPDTSPPTAPSSLAANANGIAAINLAWRPSSDNVGVTNYRLERCAGRLCTNFALIATPTASTFADSGLSAGTTYSYRVKATDAAGNLSPYSNTATATTSTTISTASGKLSGSWGVPASVVNLTTLGTADWVQWPASVRKSTGAGKISAYTSFGASTTQYSDARTMKWTDGTPTGAGSTTAAVAIAGAAAGFQFSAPADTTTRTLTVYVGVQAGTGSLIAHLSDGSAADYVKTYSSRKQRSDGVCTLTYRARSAGQSIIVKWTNNTAGTGNVSLQGAALK